MEKIKNIKFVYDSNKVTSDNKVLPGIAYVYMEDGSVKAVCGREQINTYKNMLLKQEGKSLKELDGSKVLMYNCTNNSDLLNQLDSEYKDHNKKYAQKVAHITSVNKSAFKKRIGALAVAATVLASTIGMGLGLTSCSKKNDDKDTNSNANTDTSYSNMDDLIALIDDDLKKETVSDMYKFISYSNTYLADKIAVSSDTSRYAYDLDTVIAMDLVFNNYSTEQIARIYDSKKFDTDSLSEKMKVCLSKLIPMMLRLNTSSNISTLFKDADAKAFYEKYENKLIDINNATEKDSLIQDFFTMFRSDFKEYITEDGIGSNEEQNEELMGAKIIVASSILSTVMIESPHKNGTLTDAEDKLLDNKLDACGYIEKQLAKINNVKINVVTDANGTVGKIFTDEEGNVLKFNNKISFPEIYAFMKKELNLKDEMTTVGFVTKDNEIVVSTGSGSYASISSKGGSKKTTKVYSSLSSLAKVYGENSKIVASAKAQKAQIDAKYAASNSANKSAAESEADRKASQIEKDSSDAADKKLQDIRDNAAVKDSNGNKKDDYSVVQDGDKDTANGDIDLNNDNFDGDIYDANGNVIGKSNSTTKKNSTTSSKTETTTKTSTTNSSKSETASTDDDPFAFNTGSGNNIVSSSTKRSEALNQLYALKAEAESYNTSNTNSDNYQKVK